ncbi:hypothetical protein SAMN04487917_102597 [Arthrobacter sp. yr096]|uniref:hypothetical protein n=1 Tax=Arthrobacter sp. yr096 TaxID=1761750 RepID=UPI0008CE06EE|nr:hypothetical protein [Arthrobacter sp. yr096]SEI84418.1 hypothetical protein SAMN04487917_102597 [Arthrobacter sp. yr096]
MSIWRKPSTTAPPGRDRNNIDVPAPETEEKNLRIPATAHPLRRVVIVDAHQQFSRSGSTRCITQQTPSAI